jgi:hypothetical protein
MLTFISESSRKKLIDKKIKELNLRIKSSKNPCVPAAQGTQIFFDNPNMMRQELLSQEDGGTECSK